MINIKTFWISLVGFIILSIVGVSVFFYSNIIQLDNVKNSNLSQTEIVDVMKPAIVRLMTKYEGEISVPDFDFDAKNLKIVLIPNAPPIKLKLRDDVFSTGSGFVINENGYLLTNTHVVSANYQESEKIVSLLFLAVFDAMLRSSSDEVDRLSNISEEQSEKFAIDSVKLLMSKKQGHYTARSVVLPHDPIGTGVKDLFDEGYPLKIVYENYDAIYDDLDVAIGKLSMDHLIPSIKLATKSQVNQGDKISIIGFPGNADLNKALDTEATLTTGVVSALKDSQLKDFKLIETDAKVSPGSSGGPMLDKDGNVIGIITYQTGNDSSALGDKFAFAVPIEKALEVMADNGVENVTDNYYDNFVTGLSYLHTDRCQRANNFLGTANIVAAAIGVTKQTESYIKICEDKILAGRSLDGFWQLANEYFKTISRSTLLLALGGYLAIIIISIIIFFLLNKLRKESVQVEALEDLMAQNQAVEADNSNHEEVNNSRDSNIPSPLSSQEQLNQKNFQQTQNLTNFSAPHYSNTLATAQSNQVNPKNVDGVATELTLIEMVQNMRRVGLTDKTIVEELEKQGYSSDEIKKVMT